MIAIGAVWLNRAARVPFSWARATEFTFDAGIAVMGEAGSGVYWVADED
jgi:hypothetical protein